MSREIRKVPPNWEHPQTHLPWGFDYVPMHDETYQEAMAAWQKDHDRISRGELTVFEQRHYHSIEELLADLHQPEEADYPRYRPYETSEATWLQMFESVSEGTPVTPPFATPEELIEHLVSKGTFDNAAPWPRANAERFVNELGFVPSGVIRGGKVLPGTALAEPPKD